MDVSLLSASSKHSAECELFFMSMTILLHFKSEIVNGEEERRKKKKKNKTEGTFQEIHCPFIP